jgi:hypothetical protein
MVSSRVPARHLSRAPISRVFRGVVIVSFGSVLLTGQTAPAEQVFYTRDYRIEMRVPFERTYKGEAVTLNDGACMKLPGGQCAERFVGALAVVQFAIQRIDGKRTDRATIREHVVTLAQSEGLPERPPFSMAERVAGGVISDLQAFGYEAKVAGEPIDSSGVWRRLRQELFIGPDDEPFAILEWEHRLDRVRLVRVESGALRNYARSAKQK